MEWIPVLVIAVLALVIIVRNIYVVQQSRAYVVERLGAFSNVWTVGIHFKVPFVERVAKKVSLKEQVLDYPPQPVITKDNVTMQIDTVVYFQITDPKLYTYGVEHPMIGHGESDGHDAAKHHRRSGAGPDAHLAATSSTPACARFSTKRLTRGASRSTVSS